MASQKAEAYLNKKNHPEHKYSVTFVSKVATINSPRVTKRFNCVVFKGWILVRTDLVDILWIDITFFQQLKLLFAVKNKIY